MRFILTFCILISLLNCKGIFTPDYKINSSLILYEDYNNYLELINTSGTFSKQISEKSIVGTRFGFSKSGKYIYYSSHGNYYSQLFRYSLEAETTEQLTFSDLDQAKEVRWGDISLNDSLITYYDFDGINREVNRIFFMDLSNKLEIILTPITASYYTPIFSPDQTKIACKSGRDLYIMNIDGTALERLTNIEENKRVERYIFDNNSYSLFYSVGHMHNSSFREMYKVDCRTKISEKFIPDTLDIVAYQIFPDISKIYYRPYSNHDIYCMNFNGSGIQNLTKHTSEWCKTFDVSLKYNIIAYSATIDTLKTINIYIMDLNGLNKKRLTFNEGIDSNPKISP